jgi:hypothetical protein
LIERVKTRGGVGKGVTGCMTSRHWPYPALAIDQMAITASSLPVVIVIFYPSNDRSVKIYTNRVVW